ncbi:MULTISPECIES: DUF305 domain-containing protein [Sphingomonas]|uniref:DUF305 domain-containing protein n=1 Tax=Sphingomonas TaxID=13687 RepID=UPI000DEEF8CE|nr:MULTISPECIES: DUF305 domain-containing protein [Sphingomonas]
MRTLPLLPLTALLTACGSSAPPPEPDNRGAAAVHSMGPISGDPDRDFATMMIAHHQGALDMARQEQARGRDPEMKALAAKIIADQQREIGQMQGWIRRHGGAAPAQ